MKNIVIIGGGLGGLSSGALLAKDGYRVTLLEQHSIVGGCATIFKRKGGFTCEVGLHEMDGVYTNPTIKKVFEKLDVYKNIEFVKPKEFFRVVTKHGEFVMPEGIEEAKKSLHIRFPQEFEAIENYFKALKVVKQFYEKLANLKWYNILTFPLILLPILKYKTKSVSEVLDNLSDDEALKLILNANVQYYNDTPKTLSFLLHSIAQSSYFEGGGWFIKGGSYKLSEYLASVIEDNGGEIITKANVIKADKHSVTYIHKKKQLQIQADKIISNIAPNETYKLFGIKSEEKKELADAITTLYFGFSKNLKTLYPDGRYSNFFLDTLYSQNGCSSMMQKDVTQRDIVFVDYSRVDSGLTNNEKSFGEVCMIDTIEEWEALNKEEYKEKKQAILAHVIQKLELHYPEIEKYIEYAEVATPKTVQRYIKTPNGTAYGYKPTPSQFFRVPQIKSNKVSNLYFAGQFVIAGGFSPAIISGSMCYELINKEN